MRLINKFGVTLARVVQEWKVEKKEEGKVFLRQILLKNSQQSQNKSGHMESLFEDINNPGLEVDNDNLNKQWQLLEVYNNQKIVQQMFGDSLDLKLSPTTEYDAKGSKLPIGRLGEKGPGSIEMTQYKKTSGGRKTRKKRKRKRKKRKTRRRRKTRKSLI